LVFVEILEGEMETIHAHFSFLESWRKVAGVFHVKKWKGVMAERLRNLEVNELFS
jgi:hypothetical protein